MKSLFYTIFIIGGLFCAYDYFLAPPGQKIVFKSLNPPKPKNDPVKNVETAPPVALETAPSPIPVTKQESPKSAMPATTTATAASAPSTPDVASKGPKFDPIEVLTGNWLKIPPSAFPREVKLLQDAEFKMSVGASKVAAGGKATALGAENGVLILAPTATSPARARLPLDATDLKAQLNDAYEKWKVLRAEELKAIAARKAQQQATRAVSPAAAPSSSEVEPGGKPVRAGNGTYPLLIASMQSGQVTEITPENITHWQEAQPAPVQGKSGWVVKVNYNAKTIFGPQPVEAQAVTLDGRVVGWYYTGSGEEVP
jgi:hypothetical protein